MERSSKKSNQAKGSNLKISKILIIFAAIVNMLFLFLFAKHAVDCSEQIINTSSDRIILLKENNEKLFILHFYFSKKVANTILNDIAENEKSIKECERMIKEIRSYKKSPIKNIIKANQLNMIMTKVWKNQKRSAEMINKLVIEEMEQHKQKTKARERIGLFSCLKIILRLK